MRIREMVMVVARRDRARKGRQVGGVGDCVGGDGVRDSKRDAPWNLRAQTRTEPERALNIQNA